MKLADVQEVFESVAVPEDAPGMKKYMKDHFEFYGVRSPARRDVTKEIMKQVRAEKKYDRAFFKSLWDADQRELQYFAQEYLYATRKWWPDDILDDIRYAITHKSWWDTVDYLASTVLGAVWQSDPDRYKPLIREWIYDENLWLRRAAILAQLKFGDDVDTDFLSEAIKQNADDSDFFIRKAIGWALRQYSKYNPEWVDNFVQENNLSNLSKREATKYLS